MNWFRRDKSLPQFVEVRSSGLAPQREALPCTEPWALAPAFSLESHQASVKNIPPELLAQIRPLLASAPRGGYFELVSTD